MRIEEVFFDIRSKGNFWFGWGIGREYQIQREKFHFVAASSEMLESYCNVMFRTLCSLVLYRA